MEPRPIKTEQEYDAALAEVDSLMSARAGTREMEKLELWTLHVKTYEDKHYLIERPEPVEPAR